MTHFVLSIPGGHGPCRAPPGRAPSEDPYTQGAATGGAQETMTESEPMSTRAVHQSTRAAITTRTITRTILAALAAVLFAAAIFFGEIEFVTAALLAGVAGIAVDLRQTAQLARVRVTA